MYSLLPFYSCLHHRTSTIENVPMEYFFCLLFSPHCLNVCLLFLFMQKTAYGILLYCCSACLKLQFSAVNCEYVFLSFSFVFSCFFVCFFFAIYTLSVGTHVLKNAVTLNWTFKTKQIFVYNRTIFAKFMLYSTNKAFCILEKRGLFVFYLTCFYCGVLSKHTERN